MIIFTEAGDTPASVTHRMLGHSDESYAKKLWQMNAGGFAREAMNNSGYFAPSRAVWLPGVSIHDENPDMRELLIHQTEFMDPTARYNLSVLGKQGVDINRLIGAQKAIAAHNQWHIDDPHSMAPVFFAQTTGEIINRAVEHAAHPAEKFAKGMNLLNGMAEKYALASKNQDFDLMRQLRPQYIASYKEANKGLNMASRLYADRITLRTRRFLSNPAMPERFVKNGGIWLDHFEDVNALEKLAGAGKFLGRSLFGFQLAMGGVETYRAYEKGGDWQGEAFSTISEAGLMYGIGDFLLAFTPAGWVALGIIAILEGLFMTAAGGYLKDRLKKYYHWRIKQSWHWF